MIRHMQVYDKLDEGIQILEEERRNVAYELNEGPVRSLMSVSFRLDLAIQALDDDTARARREIVSINSMIVKAINEIQQMVYNLRPLPIDQIGLISAVKQLPVKLQRQLALQIAVSDDVTDDISPAKRVAVYRFIQNVLFVCIRNQATQATLTVTRKNPDLIIKITDLGSEDTVAMNCLSEQELQGFEARATYLNGEFRISNFERGSEFVISVPVY